MQTLMERAVGVLIVRCTTPGATVGAAALTALFRLVTEHRLAVPAQVAALFRTFATLEGTLQTLDPGFDLVVAARSAARQRLTESMAPERLRRSVEDEMAALLPMLQRLPRRLDRIADAVEQGRVNLNVRLLADGQDRRFLTRLVHLSLTAVIGAVAGVMGVLFLGMRDGPQVTAALPLFAVFGYGLLVVAVVLVLRVLVVVLRQGGD
ncbi:hypothetical protein [Modestobacter altitudinis]|uniref:hypothetical protein n=1 Tax=Modestobacter altitudinis TaxID=2213158 RepID=UPI00110CD6BD|nr:hypothetical protein [Modestobacter altitudinis]